MTTIPNVQILRDDVARKIAAGEVIDRPNAVVRELLDNALDSGANRIDLHIDEGGRARIQVIDNGFGMSREDLGLCHLPHATSKIRTEDDLERVSSLGFRGEALSSVATVSRLTIRSGRNNGHGNGTDETGSGGTPHQPGNELVVHAGSVISLAACESIVGTSVLVEDLFYSVPARRSFLKRPSAETAACGSVLIDKAAAFPNVTFRFFVDRQLKLFLPAATPVQRILACYPQIGDQRLLSSIHGTGDRFDVTTITTGAAMLRRDRKLLQVFVNRRRVWEYALVQAIQHAFDPVAPGGSYPICFLFVDCDPALVDFNIHPAKREVRFRNLSDIHQRTVETLSGFLRAGVLKEGLQLRRPDVVQAELLHNPAPQSYRASAASISAGSDAAGPNAAVLDPDDTVKQDGASRAMADYPADALHDSGPSDQPFRYLGRLFDLFLLVERGHRLYIVDQHAGHERLLFDRFRTHTQQQELLVPIVVEVSEPEERVLQSRLSEISRLGISIERTAPGQWTIVGLGPAFLDHQDEVVETLREVTRHPEQIATRFHAQMACKAAIKQGDRLDAQAAETLLQQVFALPEPRCPHGRPLWVEITRDQLLLMIGRT